jgi:spore coat protein JB
MLTTMPKLYYQLLEEIQKTDFVALELNLYLDTHPDDLNAIAQYNSFSMKSKELREHFESQFGPLQNFGNSLSGFPWGWSTTPWPWQV